MDTLQLQFQKIFIPPPQKGLEFPMVCGFLRDQNNLRKMSSLIGISRGVPGGSWKTDLCGGGLDISGLLTAN